MTTLDEAAVRPALLSIAAISQIKFSAAYAELGALSADADLAEGDLERLVECSAALRKAERQISVAVKSIMTLFMSTPEADPAAPVASA